MNYTVPLESDRKAGTVSAPGPKLPILRLMRAPASLMGPFPSAWNALSIDEPPVLNVQFALMLHFRAGASEADLRLALVECGRICYGRHLMTSNDGNLSVRLGETFVLVTPAGVSKGRMTVEEILLLDLEGELVPGGHVGRPSTETPMHLEVYRDRSDVRAVIHAHPVFATSLTVADMPFPSDVLPEVLMTLGNVPVTSYAMPSSGEDADAIRPLIRDHDAILLRQHGSLTVGVDLEEALVHLERIEHAAEVFWRAQMLGHVEHLTPEGRDRLLALRLATDKNRS